MSKILTKCTQATDILSSISESMVRSIDSLLIVQRLPDILDEYLNFSEPFTSEIQIDDYINNNLNNILTYLSNTYSIHPNEQIFTLKHSNNAMIGVTITDLVKTIVRWICELESTIINSANLNLTDRLITVEKGNEVIYFSVSDVFNGIASSQASLLCSSSLIDAIKGKGQYVDLREITTDWSNKVNDFVDGEASSLLKTVKNLFQVNVLNTADPTEIMHNLITLIAGNVTSTGDPMNPVDDSNNILKLYTGAQPILHISFDMLFNAIGGIITNIVDGILGLVGLSLSAIGEWLMNTYIEIDNSFGGIDIQPIPGSPEGNGLISTYKYQYSFEFQDDFLYEYALQHNYINFNFVFGEAYFYLQRNENNVGLLDVTCHWYPRCTNHHKFWNVRNDILSTEGDNATLDKFCERVSKVTSSIIPASGLKKKIELGWSLINNNILIHFIVYMASKAKQLVNSSDSLYSADFSAQYMSWIRSFITESGDFSSGAIDHPVPNVPQWSNLDWIKLVSGYSYNETNPDVVLWNVVPFIPEPPRTIVEEMGEWVTWMPMLLNLFSTELQARSLNFSVNTIDTSFSPYHTDKVRPTGYSYQVLTDEENQDAFDDFVLRSVTFLGIVATTVAGLKLAKFLINRKAKLIAKNFSTIAAINAGQKVTMKDALRLNRSNLVSVFDSSIPSLSRVDDESINLIYSAIQSIGKLING